MTYSKVGWAEDTARSVANFNNMETQYDEAVAYADTRYGDLQTVASDWRNSGNVIYTETRAAAPATPSTGQVYFNTTDNRYYGYNGTVWLPLVGKMTLFDGTATDTMIPKTTWVESVHSDAGQFANDEGAYLHFKIMGKTYITYAVFEIAETMYANYRGVIVDWELLDSVDNTWASTAYIILPGIRLNRSAHSRQQEYIPVDNERKFFSEVGVGIRQSYETVEFKIWKLEIVL